jgi:colanic acid biosynthesis glycosyl transferase WcaI
MASGRPIIATVDQNTEVGRLLDQAHCGLCIDPEDADALVQAIKKLSQDKSIGKEMGRRGRDFCVKHYSRQVSSNLYFNLIQKFAGKAQ